MVHGRTGTIRGRSAERPTRSSTGKGRIVKEEEDSQGTVMKGAQWMGVTHYYN